MSQNPTPDPEKVKQTIAKAHRVCQELELAGLQLEEVIVKIEQENRARRRETLEKFLKTSDK